MPEAVEPGPEWPPAPPATRIFTVGHSNHEPGPFFALLSRHRISHLVDVRSIPSSGRFPHFKKRNFEALCKARSVSYRHCPELGNKVGGICHLLRQPEGQDALAELAAAAAQHAEQGATAYMCAEADWRDCHRQVIAQQLSTEYGIVTFHVLRTGSIEPHPSSHVLPPHYGAGSLRLLAPCCPEERPAARAGAPEAGPVVAGSAPEAHGTAPAGAEEPVPPPPAPPAGAGAAAEARPRARRWGKAAAAAR